MALTQESVLSFLLERGGKATNSELVTRFKSLINSDDPAEKQHNRELFKKLVNSVAVVKHIDQVKFVVVKKRYQDFVAQEEEEEDGEEEKASRMDRGVSSRSPSSPPPVRTESHGHGTIDSNNRGRDAEDVQKRGSFSDSTGLRVLNISGDQPLRAGRSGAVFAVIAVKSPGRDSAPALTEAADFSSCVTDSFKKTQSWESKQTDKQPRLQHKATRQADEAGRYSDSVPLDALAHEWLVKCAAGLWGQIYSLLLRDSRLAHRKDFMSGFTALHWAAKDGNADMIHKLMDVSRKRGARVDVDCKSHGGYTPLHVAAMHGHAHVVDLLVRRYGASVSERDNDGKKAVHYLERGAPAEVRALLGGLLQRRERDEEQEDKEHTRGFNSISKLFHPHTGKKHKTHKFSHEC